MEIVIFGNQVSIQEPQEPVQRGWWSRVNPKAAVSEKFGIYNELLTEPPLVEAHGKPHKLHGYVSHERNTNNVEEFLLMVGVQTEHSVWMLCEVMCAVIFPKTVNLVHETVIPVEPKVKHDAVESYLQGQEQQVDGRGSLAGTIAENYRQHRAQSASKLERVDHLGYCMIRNLGAKESIYVCIKLSLEVG